MTLSGWVNINKPSGMNSNRVSTVVKGVLGAKRNNIKVGFTGTLDPFATGLLTFAIGNATKCIDFIPNIMKSYEFTVYWGEHRDTHDVDGELAESSDVIPNPEDISRAASAFIGETMQCPPLFSAVKINGTRACDLVRRGRDIATQAKPIFVEHLAITRHSERETSFQIRCRKGCYIRSLAVDLAKSLGALCYVSQLKRTSDGLFSINDAISLENFKSLSYDEAIGCILPVDEVLDDIPAIRLDPAGSHLFVHGGFPTTKHDDAAVVRVYDDGSQLLGFASVCGGVARPRKVFIGENDVDYKRR